MQLRDFQERLYVPSETILVYRIEDAEGYGMYQGFQGAPHGNDWELNPCTSDDWIQTFQDWGAEGWWEIKKKYEMRHGFKSLLDLYNWFLRDAENLKTMQGWGYVLKVYMVPEHACIHLSKQTVFCIERVKAEDELCWDKAILLILNELQDAVENSLEAA